VSKLQGGPVPGRTRWRRFAGVMAPAAVAAGAIVFGIANGAIAASFSVSGTTFKVSADKIVATGFVQYGGLATTPNLDPQTGMSNGSTTTRPVAVAGMKTADITKMCQSVRVPGTPWTLLLTAGDKGTPASATDLMFDMTDLTSSSAVFTNINIGQDASTLTGGPVGTHGAPGGFAQQATNVTLNDVKQVAWRASAGTFNLNGLEMHIKTDGTECF
jgi:hypothetical protein